MLCFRHNDFYAIQQIFPKESTAPILILNLYGLLAEKPWADIKWHAVRANFNVQL